MNATNLDKSQLSDLFHSANQLCRSFRRGTSFSFPLFRKNHKVIFIFLFLPFQLWSQTTIMKETIGTYSGTISVTAYTGWSNGGSYSHAVSAGSVALNSAVISSNYSGASGGTPVRVSANSTWVISGINTLNQAGVTLSFGIHKSNFKDYGQNLFIEVSADGINYAALSWTSLPTGPGTGDTWHYREGGVHVTGTIPSTSNLRLRIRNASTDVYDFDDIELKGSDVLPLDFLNFRAKKTAEGALLFWQTANEQNVSHFDLQRSQDGRSFFSVRQLTARNSGKEETYEITDHFSSNERVYYRVRSIDRNGHVTLSKVITVVPVAKSYELSVIGKEKQIEILSSAAFLGKVNYEIISLEGVLMQRGELMIGNGKTSLMLNTLISRGLYVLNIRNGEYQQSFKVNL